MTTAKPRRRKRLVYARDAHKYVHEDTARSVSVFAGWIYVDGEKVRTEGNMIRTACGYWFNAFDGHEKYWRWNLDGRKIDCPECLMRAEEEDARYEVEYAAKRGVASP